MGRFKLPNDSGAGRDEAQTWEADYARNASQCPYWSLLGDGPFVDTLCDLVPEGVQRILIPGCGPNPAIQARLLSTRPELRQVVCIDLAQHAIQRAATAFSHSRLTYHVGDVRLPHHRATFDAAICVNSVLSSSDVSNRGVLSAVAAALKPGGRLIGIFPCIFAELEVSLLAEELGWFRNGLINLSRSTFHDPDHDTTQIFYTPLRLRAILHDAGFTSLQMNIHFCDTPYIRRLSRERYRLPDTPGLDIWELLVQAEKADE